jgi:hypothetical protein
MVEGHGNWRRWRDFFAARATRAAPQILDDDPCLASIPKSVARSLAVFQLGESGGGTVIEQARTSTLPGVDKHYAEAMALFVAEEHRHAELLACCVRALRGELIRKNWTASLFVFGRRLIGLRLKVMVLLAAEVVGICYYHLLAEHLPGSGMKRLLQEIVEDEKAHLKFHCSFLRTQAPDEVQRAVFMITWRALMFAAAVVVLFDHRKALRDLAIPPGVAWKRWMVYSRTAENRVIQKDCRTIRALAMR